MESRRVSVAEGKREFTQLLKEAQEKGIPILIINERAHRLAGVILSPDEYERYEKLRAYFEALRLSQKYAHLKVDLPELVRQAREELEDRTRG